MTQQDLRRLSYSSRSAIRADDTGYRRQLNEILATSQANNARLDISGQLLARDGAFFQILEGPDDAVTGLYEHICQDPRHFDIKLLDDGFQNTRLFSHWSMGVIGNGKIARPILDDMAFDVAKLEDGTTYEEVVIAMRIAEACGETMLRL